MPSDETARLDYKTHVLLGVRVSGAMYVMCTWTYVPRQAEVQEQIDATRESYENFLLCTPTAIMPGNRRGFAAPRR